MDINNAILKLANEFNKIDFNGLTFKKNGYNVQKWLGKENDSIMICLLKSKHTKEDYHKQDYFFFNYAYQNNYKALSQKYNNLIEIKEGECYFSKPDCGYAINIDNMDNDSIIVGVLIKKDVFFKEYLSIIATSDTLFNFFLTDSDSTLEYIKLKFNDNVVKNLLNLMILEYAGEDDQDILKSYTMSLLLLIAREYKKANQTTNILLIDKIVKYINQNLDSISLNNLSKAFGYHPNYMSYLIHKSTGSTFNDLVTNAKMDRAKILLNSTTLSIEEISNMLGYSDTSNFYKAFKKKYKTSPRNYN